MERNRFLIILALGVIFFAIFNIFLPRSIADRVGLTKIPIIQNARNRFEVDKNTQIILLGDVMLGRTVLTTSEDLNDYVYPFRKIAELTKDADLTVANLESPIVTNCPRFESGFTFCSDPKMVEGLTYSGIDMVNLANNHNQNFGSVGLEETKKYLGSAGILYSNRELAVKEINGLKVGLLGFDKSQQSNPNLTLEEQNLVRDADSKVDILIVSMHWGVEYQEKALQGVVELAKELVNLGADVIHGHHPHWVQNVEYLNGVPVYYSLGNFVFDQMWSEETKKGLMVKLTFDSEGRFVRDEQTPVYTKALGQPEKSE